MFMYITYEFNHGFEVKNKNLLWYYNYLNYSFYTYLKNESLDLIIL